MTVKEFLKVVSGIDKDASDIAIFDLEGNNSWGSYPITDKRFQDKEIEELCFDSKADFPFVRIYLK